MAMKRNVPGWERILRVGSGVAIAVAGAFWAGNGNLVLGLIVVASGLGWAATGLVGWCPICAAVGRTLPETDHKIQVAKL